jgi:hypothetical protein
MIAPSDQLRTPDNICLPDSRSPKADFLTKQPLTVEYQYSAISGFVLHDGVPEDIRIQFETTRNLYLYAWYVYRFYPVVKLHAYTCLELALRMRFGAKLAAARKGNSEYIPGLKKLLLYAIDNGHIKNENFSVWRHRAKQRAERRTKERLWEEAQRNGLSEITFDASQIEITDDDCDHDYLETILATTPELRNHYAHGSKSLDNQAIGTVSLVVEIINQIFPVTMD